MSAVRIRERDIVQIAGVCGFGFAARKGIRDWMRAKGFHTYEDFAAAYAGVPHKEIQLKIEAFVFCGDLS